MVGLALGVAWGLAAATPWSWGYWPYYNPYYVAPIVVGGTTIDYSQPILAAGQAAVPPEQLANQAPPADHVARFSTPHAMRSPRATTRRPCAKSTRPSPRSRATPRPTSSAA